MSDTPIEVVDNKGASRFESTVDGHLAVVEYERRAGGIALMHTDVPRELAGRGIAAALVKEALEQARAAGLKVVPVCEYASAYLRKHPEYQDLVAR